MPELDFHSLTLHNTYLKNSGEICAEIASFLGYLDSIKNADKQLNVLILGSNETGLNVLDTFIALDTKVVLADYENPVTCTMKNPNFTHHNLSFIPAKLPNVNNPEEKVTLTVNAQKKALIALLSEADIVVNTISHLEHDPCLFNIEKEIEYMTKGSLFIDIAPSEKTFDSFLKPGKIIEYKGMKIASVQTQPDEFVLPHFN